MNWEAVLIAAVPGSLALLGFVYQEYRKRKNAQSDAKTTSEMRKEPTWPELVEENRSLRKDLETERIERRKDAKETDKRFTDFEKRLEDLEKEKRLTEWAASHVMREAADQWPSGYPAPILTPAYTAPIIHILPYPWRTQAGI